jgi:LDH2 family malate/lactate/ureidoglycolate dehydrogenase
MLLPAGGAKGFGLAVMLDLLAGGLAAGAVGDEVRPLYGDPAIPYGCAHFFLAIEIEAFRPLDAFRAAAARFAERIRASKPAPGAPAPRMPGDRAAQALRRNAGVCHVAAPTAAALGRLARRLGVSPPSWAS